MAHLVDPIAKLLIKARITPDALTWFGAGATLVISVAFLAQGDFLLGAMLFGAFSLIDLLDGTMARMLGTSGAWGAFLDSTLDRVSDAAVICGICFYYASNDLPNSKLVVSAGVIALVMGLMTSYARAKAESLNANCTIGIAERAERNILIWISLLITSLVTDVMSYAFVILAVVSTITVIQRIVYVRKQLVS
ncbi:MAG: CDP-alcohol phosphatidyltransferase family protein [Actinomycetes bacterium]